MTAASLRHRKDGQRLTVAGIVLVRQRPGKGNVVFVTLEDETGIANLVVWIPVFERFRRIVMGARLIACTGKLQIQGEVIHIVAERMVDMTPYLRRLGEGAGRMPAKANSSSRSKATISTDPRVVPSSTSSCTELALIP